MQRGVRLTPRETRALSGAKWFLRRGLADQMLGHDGET